MDGNNGVEKQSRTQRLNQCLLVGRESGKGQDSKDSEVHTTMCKINKLQGHTLQHREYSQQFIIALKKNNLYIEPQCCTSATTIIL